jgi:uncharacterized protein (TIGR02996 family)
MPTDEERALWAAIRANPRDDTPRLVYADWLQENGGEDRAEFIRVQIELAKLPYDRRMKRKERKLLEGREAELLKANKPRWIGDLCRALKGEDPAEWEIEWRKTLIFERGFIRWLYLNLPAALRLIASGIELEPVEYLEVSHSQFSGAHSVAAVAEVTAWKQGPCVTAFSLAGAADEDVSAFLTGGRLTQLRRLDLWGGSVTDTAVAALACSPLLAPIRTLTLSANTIGDPGAEALADSPHISEECSINLYSNPIGETGRARLRARFGDRVELRG